MNKFFTTFLIIISAISINTYAQSVWQWQQPQPTGNYLYTVDFINENTGFAGGKLGTFMKTTNGGINWEASTINPDFEILGIDFYDAELGFAVGYLNGSIFRTTNGGENWSNVFTSGVVALWDIYFPSRSTGYAAGLNGRIYKSTNSGLNWIQQNSLTGSNLFSIDFIDTLNGVAGGTNIITKTTDGGQTWINQNIVFANVTTIVTTADYIDENNIICLAQGDDRIYKTSNNGINWNAIIINRTDNDFQRTISFINPDTGIMVTDYGRIMQTTNGGVSWNTDSSFVTPGYDNLILRFSDFESNNVAYVSGSGGRVIKSTNGGLNWFTTTGGRYNYNSNYFIDQNTGFSVGNEGKILKTTNAGVNWVEKQSNTVQNLNEVQFVRNDIGYIIGDTGVVLKSTDGGEIWHNLNLGVTSNFNGLFFTDINSGFICGNHSKIMRTTDGGTNWISQNSGVSANAVLGKLFFVNSDTGFMSGSFYLRTTNSGINWISDGNSGGLDVFFTDYYNGYRPGGSGIILKSTDGGINWIVQSGNVLANINSIFLLNKNNGFAVGNDGAVTKTTNGGINWIPQAKLTANSLNSVFFTDADNGYITGDFGTLIKTTNGGLTFITQNSVSYPKDFTLYQNYPNPFNSGTVIKYNLRTSGFVELKLYDITGKEIQKLVKEYQSAGSYNVSFNSSNYGNNIHSGIFLYSLYIDKKIINTKKLILIK